MTIRVGVAGCRRSRSFVGGLRATGFELVAAMDPDEEALVRFAKEAGVPPGGRYTAYSDLIAHGLDAVVLGSPMPNHAPQAILALERGIHVLSEVPAAISIDQCLRLRDAVRASKAGYMMAENYVYVKSCQLVLAMVRAGVFGDLYHAEGEYLHDVRNIAAMPDGTFTWRKRWQLDRRGVTYPTHAIGPVLQWLDDRVTALSARGTGNHTDPNYTGDDSAVMLCSTAKGSVMRIRTDLHSRRPHNMSYLQLQGTKGCYEAPRGLGDDHKVYVEDGKDDAEWRPLWDFEKEYLPEMWRTHERAAKKAGHGGGDYFEFLDFAAVCQGKPCPIGIHTALDWTLPGLVSELSIERGGESVAVPDPRTDELDRAAEEERASGRFAGFEEHL